MSLNPSYDSYRRLDTESDVLPRPVKGDSEILQTTANLIYESLRKYTPDQVVVLSAQKAQLSDLMSKVKVKTTEVRTPRPGSVRWGSVHEFKGLEALAVILVEFEASNPSIRETFYVGATRSIYDFSFVIPMDKIKNLAGEANEQP